MIDRPEISKEEIPYQVACNAHANTSFSPGKRATSRQEEYVQQLNSDWDYLASMCKPEQQELLFQQFERYRQRFRKYYLLTLYSHARIASPMITGPANFPVRRNDKANNAYRRRVEEMLDFRKRALRAISRELFPDRYMVTSGNPEAISLLKKQLEERLESGRMMVEANKIIKKHVRSSTRKTHNGEEYVPASITYKTSEEEARKDLSELKLTDKQITEILNPHFGDVGFPSYALSNNSANARRIRKRIEQLEKIKERGTIKRLFLNDITIVEDSEAARFKIIFPGKPDADTIAKLKKRGFKYSPTNNAWQRHLNGNGAYAVRSIILELELTEIILPVVEDDTPEALLNAITDD